MMLVESLKLEYHRFKIKNKNNGLLYVINLGIQHHKIWKFYIQSKYSQSHT